MKHISINILKPAQINISSTIDKVIILNRSLPAKDKLANNIAEGILTGEGIMVDRGGSRECLKGVINKLANSPRFKAVIDRSESYKGTGTDRFPELLNWKQVQDICNQYNADALITLATFDSDKTVRYKEGTKIITKDNKKIKVPDIKAYMDIVVKSGWRIYDAKNKIIIDEHVFEDISSWNGSGRTEKQAKSNLPPLRNAISDAGYYAGQMYASRISPQWIWVSRRYYKKANDDFKRARRMADSEEWEEAAKIWKKYVNVNDPKIAGYATYNMGLAAEVRGDLEAALDWIKTSYVDFNNKKARDYKRKIEIRIKDQERLEQQLNTVVE
jgi:tetratricopeptide (TPR) repeat protein